MSETRVKVLVHDGQPILAYESKTPRGRQYTPQQLDYLKRLAAYHADEAEFYRQCIEALTK